MKFIATSKLLDEKEVIGAEWSELGGVVSNLYAFENEVNYFVGRCVLQIQTTGAGATLRLTSANGAIKKPLSLDVSLPDTAGAWQILKINTAYATEGGDRVFALEGKTEAGTTARVRYASLSLLSGETPMSAAP